MLVFFLVCLFFQKKGKQRQAVEVDSHADFLTCCNFNQARWEDLFQQYCQYKTARSEGGPKDHEMEC